MVKGAVILVDGFTHFSIGLQPQRTVSLGDIAREVMTSTHFHTPVVELYFLLIFLSIEFPLFVGIHDMVRL